MFAFPSIQQIKTSLLTCSNPEHQNQPTDFMCVDQQCLNDFKSSNLLCFLCEQQQKQKHKQHQTVSTRSIINKIQEIQETNQEIFVLCATVDNELRMMRNLIEAHKGEFEDYQQVIRSFQREQEWIRKKSSLLSKIKEQFISAYRQNKGNKLLLQQYFKKFVNRNFSLLQENQSKKQKQIQKKSLTVAYYQSILQQTKTLHAEIQKLKKQNKLNNYNLLSLFTFAQQFNTGITSTKKYYFEEGLMGSCHKMLAPNIAEMSTSGQQRMLILQPSLQNNLRVKRWKIKIRKLASWIGLGVCHFNKIKDANFNFNYSSTGHGSYLISSNGYSWSSYKLQNNSKHGSFSFKTGDIVELQYHPKDCLLKFRQLQTDNVFELQTQRTGDKIHPAVNLTGIGDSVQILY